MISKTITFYKTWTGWAFDDSATDTWEEPMINGSEDAMTHWFEKTTGVSTNPTSTIKAKISTEANVYTFKMTKTGQTEEGTTYIDTDLKVWWLCPYLNQIYGDSPSHLFITIQEAS